VRGKLHSSHSKTCRALDASFKSGSISLMCMTAPHCGQCEIVAVGEGDREVNTRISSSNRISPLKICILKFATKWKSNDETMTVIFCDRSGKEDETVKFCGIFSDYSF